MKKILASDYDDTFFTNNEEIKKNIEYSKEFRKNGNIFMIATGRTYINFKKLLEKNKFKYDYLIINHGGTVLDSKNNIIANYTIKNNIKDEICNIIRKNGYESIFACDKLDTVDINKSNITKIGVIFESADKAYNMNECINNNFSTDVKSYYIPNRKMIEIVSIDTNKAKRIEDISKLEKVEKENIYTIGDSYNDIEMIKQFNGYAMINALHEVKKNSIGQVNGVYELIEKIS